MENNLNTIKKLKSFYKDEIRLVKSNQKKSNKFIMLNYQKEYYTEKLSSFMNSEEILLINSIFSNTKFIEAIAHFIFFKRFPKNYSFTYHKNIRKFLSFWTDIIYNQENLKSLKHNRLKLIKETLIFVYDVSKKSFDEYNLAHPVRFSKPETIQSVELLKINYEIRLRNGKKEIYILSSPESASNLVIPSSINGIPVRGIEGNAFAGRLDLLRIVFPNKINTIYNNAFNGCINLIKIYFPDNYSKKRSVYINEDSFMGCNNMTVSGGANCGPFNIGQYENSGEYYSTDSIITSGHNGKTYAVRSAKSYTEKTFKKALQVEKVFKIGFISYLKTAFFSILILGFKLIFQSVPFFSFITNSTALVFSILLYAYNISFNLEIGVLKFRGFIQRKPVVMYHIIYSSIFLGIVLFF